MNYQDGTALALLRNFYSKQAHLIDAGQHDRWARTFVSDGEFHSPTYGAPAVGYDELRRISEEFSLRAEQSGEQHRHLVENMWVTRCDMATAEVQAYLLIVGTDSSQKSTRILRVVTIIDQLERSGEDWLVRCRTVQY